MTTRLLEAFLCGRRLALLFAFLILVAGVLLPFLLSVPEGDGVVVIVLFLLVWLLGLSLLNRLVLSGVLGLGLILLIDWVGRTKMMLLNTPFRADDLLVFAADFAANVEVLWSYPAAVRGLVVTIVLVVAVALLCFRYEGPALRSSGGRRLVFYRLLLVPVILVGGLRLWLLRYEAEMRAFARPMVVGVTTYRNLNWLESHQRDCNVAQFVRSFAELGVWSPGSHGDPSRFLAEVALLRGQQAKPQGRRPDIFVVLEESLFDPRILSEYAQTTIPMLEDQRGAVSSRQGTLRIHSYGGGTCVAELAFLAGFYWGEFGPAGSYAPYVVTPHLRSSLPLHLKALGYRTIVVTPTLSGFLGARQAYANYGFDEYYPSEALGMSKNWLEIMDGDVFRFAEQRADEAAKDSRPVFVFVVTIRNHGPHERVLPEGPSGLGTDPVRSPEMRDYLDRVADSSRSFLALQERWLSSPRDRVLMFFGDHLPALQGKLKTHVPVARHFSPYGEETTWNRTPYALRANFGLKPLREPTGDVDIAFLGSILLESSAMESGPLFGELRLLSQVTDYKWVDARDRELVESYLSHVVRNLGVLH